ncbi:3-deoxy-manno-octulosonate cytidylyltransferase [bacterium]|nr:3-deoxy-manno-octulosonate cytidylyltransferase [bacterium]
MKILAVIPARYASTRFPGKPLALLAGKPMIQHVWERCRAATAVERIIVATDHDEILNACHDFGAEAVVTPPELPSGTDRVAFVARSIEEYGGVLNVQGDEPRIRPETINAVAKLLSSEQVTIATAAAPMHPDEAADPNKVKVALAESGRALYFSRAVIPYRRNPASSTPTLYYRHLGLYGYRRATLLELTQLRPSPLEQCESLEQLRWLEAGYSIFCAQVPDDSIGVDTPEDLRIAENKLLNQD